jgi:hypothetical protein
MIDDCKMNGMEGNGMKNEEDQVIDAQEQTMV